MVGCFHLVGLPLIDSIGGTMQDIKDLGLALLHYPIDKLYTGHCTGQKAYGLLKEVLRETLEAIPTGSCINVLPKVCHTNCSSRLLTVGDFGLVESSDHGGLV